MTERTRPAVAGPLAGVRVLDFCHFLAGPYATMVLAELGAASPWHHERDRSLVSLATDHYLCRCEHSFTSAEENRFVTETDTWRIAFLRIAIRYGAEVQVTSPHGLGLAQVRDMTVPA